MIFRIEDNQNSNGNHREYEIPFKDLPILKLNELENYLAEKIRKEVNNTQDRNLLSYSKSLGICLLKYNKFADNELHIDKYGNGDGCISFCFYKAIRWMLNELHINEIEDDDGFSFYSLPFDKQILLKKYVFFDLKLGGLYGLKLSSKNKEEKIVLVNFDIDVSDNNFLDIYLRDKTGTGRKKVASPEKDKEVLIMQSPDDMVVSDYLPSVYLLYALVLRYGMNKSIHKFLYNKIYNLDDYYFAYCEETERDALLTIIDYLYYYDKDEQMMIKKVLKDCKEMEHLSVFYDPILQLLGIQEDNFEYSYMLGDYNSNIVSEWIWYCYNKYM